ncbi:YdeI/OmpD-associated family protein [Rhodococcoides corynebacterioides]|uniref:YdeI/OmpD-associated family protein n=1 Tax=Rhodococcoides corynebacterioides TaxID=53972 RepID=A0ABS7NZ54_9NOCA|nr:YdeI/OmpD-associated family protein [Rhodococcus corynebacterioides]MBY6365419.1 YdeI/OmpD-associated family protein [Rhodococcus corynebacterioides]MBY6407927.1 YdeI/OmpD-associated family protein [Rhodococcus corynebacterioides]
MTVRVRIGRMGGENLVGLNKAVRARKEHARSVADAKRDDTRARRVAAVVAALRES